MDTEKKSYANNVAGNLIPLDFEKKYLLAGFIQGLKTADMVSKADNDAAEAQARPA